MRRQPPLSGSSFLVDAFDPRMSTYSSATPLHTDATQRTQQPPTTRLLHTNAVAPPHAYTQLYTRPPPPSLPSASRHEHLYSLYTVFIRWQELAFPAPPPPPGLVIPKLRSADAEWPLGAVLPATICLLRSGKARAERLRSMRRWHMLYTAHGAMLPRTFSHLACLAKGRRSHSEYHFYVQLAAEMIDAAAAELLVARLRYGVRSWRRAIVLLSTRDRYGTFSLVRRSFLAWSAAAAMSAAISEQAMGAAYRWLAHEWRTEHMRLAMRVWRADVMKCAFVRTTRKAVRSIRRSRGFVHWAATFTLRRRRRTALAHDVVNAIGILARGRVTHAFEAWTARVADSRPNMEALHLADAHAIRLTSMRLRRGLSVWMAVCNIRRSLVELMICAHARVNAHRAWRLWARYTTRKLHSRKRFVAAIVEAAVGERRQVAMLWGWRTWRQVAWADRRYARELTRAWVEGWAQPAARRALHIWRDLRAARRLARKTVRTMMNQRSAYAWRAWVSWCRARRGLHAVARQLIGAAENAQIRASAAGLASAVRAWRQIAVNGRQAATRRALGKRVVLRLCHRDAARAFGALVHCAGRSRALAALLSRAIRASGRWGVLRGWEVWKAHHRWCTETVNTIAIGAFANQTHGRRRDTRRYLWEWLHEARWRRRATAAAGQWLYPALVNVFARLARLCRLSAILSIGFGLVRQQRRARALAAWAEASVTRRLTRAMMQHASRERWSVLTHEAMMLWRHEAARRVRLENFNLRRSQHARLGAAAQKWGNVLRRAAFRAIRAEAQERAHSHAATAALGRCLTRIDKSETIFGWRSFVAWEGRALAIALDAFPALHRRSHLRHWYAVTAGARTSRTRCVWALSRWANATVGQVLTTWREHVRAVEAARQLLTSVANRWRHRAINAALRTWCILSEVRRSALSVLHRAFASWRRGRLGRGWRAWASMVARAETARYKMVAAMRRMFDRGLSRALAQWTAHTQAALRAMALLARALPAGRKLLLAMQQWVVVWEATSRNLVAIASALAYSDSHLLRALVRAWRDVTFRAIAERRGIANTLASLQGTARAFRTWREVATASRHTVDTLQWVFARGFLRDVCDAFEAVALAARKSRQKRISAGRWRHSASTFAITAWREEAAVRARSRGLAMRSAAALFGARIPQAWHTWAANASMVIDAVWQARCALGHWRTHGFARAWVRWTRWARDASSLANDDAGYTKRLRAWRCMQAHRLARRARELASFAVLASRVTAAVDAWQRYTDACHASRPSQLRAERFWRRLTLARALERIGGRVARLKRTLGLDSRADERRALAAIAEWSTRADVLLTARAKIRRAAMQWQERAAPLGFATWASVVRRYARIERSTRRWGQRRLSRGMNAWVASSVSRAAHMQTIDECVGMWGERARQRVWRTWIATVDSRRRALRLVLNGSLYWRRLCTVDGWTRWLHVANEHRQHANKRLLAALRIWRAAAARGGMSDDASSSAGSDYATGAARGGASLSAGTTRRTTVVVFGAGSFGQLGHGGDGELIAPTRLAGLGALRVRAAACGDYHTALLSSDGEIFTFGIGEFGVLGHGNEERSLRPRRVESLVGEHAVSAACGWRHTVCLTASGRLYSWGHGGFGQLGHGGLIHFFLPLQLHPAGANGRSSAASRPGAGAAGGWQAVACGWRHTAALGEGGVAHTWGDGEHLQLGHGDRRGQVRPKLIDTFRNEAVRQLECGSHHCAAIAGSGKLYTWGSGSFGQLGHGERRSEAIPRLVGSLGGIEAVRVACGSHTCVLGAHGELYTFGNGKHGQLGHGEQRGEATPRRVHALRHVRVLGIACGDFHTLALGDDGGVYTWGAGAYGELGHGDVAHYAEPRWLETLHRRALLFAACGASHNVILLAPAERGLYGHDADDSDADEGSGSSAEESATTAGPYQSY